MVGKFIVFEGIDGSGTSTQSELLKDFLLDNGISSVTTCEPSSGPIGNMIREGFKKRLSFVSDKKLFDGLSRQNFFARVKKYQREAGIDREINPAMLRNTAMYSFIEEGTTMRELKERLDYVNIGMSGIYKIRNKSDIKKVYKKIGIGDWDVSEFN